jgi:hypothetical protein
MRCTKLVLNGAVAAILVFIGFQFLSDTAERTIGGIECSGYVFWCVRVSDRWSQHPFVTR